MAYNWQTDQYKQKVSALGGYFDNKGDEAKVNTGWHEAVDPSSWQSGGWYTNPNSGKVERWWSGNPGGGSNGGNDIGSLSTGGHTPGNANVKLPERPKIDLKKTYNDLYSQLGLADLKAKVEAKQQEILALRQQTDEAAALINENPWASSVNRTGRLAKLEEDYNKKAAVITAQASLEQQKYQDAMGELNTQMSLTTQQYGYDVNNFDANLNQLNMLLDMGALDNASVENLNNIGAQTGMSADMISSMIRAQKNARVKPTLIEKTDDYGNVTVTLVDANTGNVINQQSLGAIDASRMRQTVASSSRLPDGNKKLTAKEKGLANLYMAIEDYLDGNMAWAMQHDPVNAEHYQYIWLDQFQSLYKNYAQAAGLSFKQFLDRATPYIKPKDYQRFANLYSGSKKK